MQGLRRALAKVLILVPLAVFAILFAIGPGGLVSYTSTTRVSVNSMLALWISIPAGLIVLVLQKNTSKSNLMYFSALVFAFVLHSGSAALNVTYVTLLGDPIVERALVNTVDDLLEFAIFGVLLAIAGAYSSSQRSHERFSLSNKLLLPFIMVTPLIIFGGLRVGYDYISQESLMQIGWVFGIIAIVGYILASVLVTSSNDRDLPIDAGLFISSTLLLCVASLVALSNMTNPTIGWEYAETLEMAAFLLLCVSFGVPFLKRSGYRRRTAYGFVIGLILMAYLPFLLTIILDSFSYVLPLGPEDTLAYSIIHIGAASLSGMMAILLYIYPKKKTSWNHYPLVLLFGLWAIITLLLIFMLSLLRVPLRGERITPIVVGSFITLGLLLYAARWTTAPPRNRAQPSILRMSVLLTTFAILVIFGETANQIALSINPELEFSPYGAILILVVNLVIMWVFTYLIFVLSEGTRGKAPIEMYIIFFLGMWILPNILKSYYNTWSTGWWVSEILLFVGLLAGPPLLIWLYVRAMRDEQESYSRASLYADLLMHDVSNYNQMVMTSLELLGSDEISGKQRKRLAEDGFKAVSFSEQLIMNVRLLSESDSLEISRLEKTNLVSTIVSALDIFTHRVGSGEIVVNFNPETAYAPVMANELLVHVFLNILHSSLECRILGETVTIELQSIIKEGEEFWQIKINAPGMPSANEEEYSSAKLGLKAAELMTESMNGRFQVETQSRDDECEERIFKILLRAGS
ncbi:MAG: hypothetical protein ACFFCP_04500 [Promethearchaeota archaeon]